MYRSIAVIAVAFTAMSGCGREPGAAVDEIFADYAGPSTPGAAVLVVRDGEKLLTRTYGVSDIATRTPITAATNFRLASVTKQFTAMAILMLIEEGSLTLDTTLGELFPDFHAYAQDITIRELLRHQSGLPDYEPMVPEGAEPVRDDDVLRLMLETKEGYFEPGSAYRYSNSGYAVLAMIVETLSGHSFAEFLDERIFTPLGMDNTVAFEKGVSSVPNRAYGYTVTDEGIEFTDQSRWSSVLGDGGVYSSLNDLYRWDQALYRDDLITADSKAQMLTPSLEDYGFGWRIDRFDGHLRYHHSGSTSGFRNFIQRFPEQRLTIIVLTNRAEPDVQPLAEEIAALYL
ncbi:MAG: serine hydrolase domain-containing protein [Woeseiaceae bacterium]|nr:serine hydrolase domain-containing protein [Woeseiaceae bacterium]